MYQAVVALIRLLYNNDSWISAQIRSETCFPGVGSSGILFRQPCFVNEGLQTKY